MLKWNVQISGDVFAKDAKDATERILELLTTVRGGETIKEDLVEDECFDYSTTVNVYGE